MPTMLNTAFCPNPSDYQTQSSSGCLPTACSCSLPDRWLRMVGGGLPVLDRQLISQGFDGFVQQVGTPLLFIMSSLGIPNCPITCSTKNQVVFLAMSLATHLVPQPT
ncbi:hypothetical protein O6H91_21G045000 [Diphasiastrum complanatum]|uniref:Uncharacterized protein n=1 Tax=Diphasiastrum complanatum TaxID=34168 RepID=A0ACC2AK88_DIPCM|nr:hypothetical protein O6H91_21G045000 [Diphasiastrum complanatum]